MTILSVNDLKVDFDTPDGTVNAVKGVSFDIRAGECLGIVGESGSGKSQSFMAAMGLMPPNGRATGGVELQGEQILNLPVSKLNRIRGADVGMIFQDPLTALTPHLKIGEQMAEVLKVHKGLSGREARAQCLDWLDRVRIPEARRRLKQYPHELSGGMRQRVMIAQAMLCEPKLLIADEPTTALDVTVQAEVLDLMDRLKDELGTAIALITHDMGVVARMCDRIKVMRLGEFVEEGEAKAIFDAPSHAYTQRLLEAMPRIDKGEANRTETGEEILTVDDMKVHFPIRVEGGLFGRTVPLKAVNGVSFGLRAGETLGIVGESGCGKSTLARAVLRLVEPTDGTVSWFGKPLNQLDKKALKNERKDLQIVFQDPLASLDPRMTIADSIAEPLKTFRPELSKSERQAEVVAMMERVGLEREKYNRYPHELSGGQNQRVGIARAMINRPKLIICDEAVSALDVSIQAQIVTLLKELQAEFGMSMLFISHDLSVVREISNRIMVLYLGRVVEMGDADTICTAPVHPYTRSLISAVPIPDPVAERERARIRLPGELPSPLDPRAALRFLPSKLAAGEEDYVPRLTEVAPGHMVAEHDALEDIMAREKKAAA
ncbi:oligopeptide ABC transporter ATP-binding protein OppD [Roseivivax sp. GX 12232]|uniref:ABC transporter ATP-binding protein n=1 Tax=Roseivivax sp. GX 12232 TaxID=2900547 RepID=UPI001E423E82|nr:dipeptide ABC transporter ATP-binding protein [Roseivivax sp. GX 12232]MCE0503861.1 oligopeptide ABC transporter ATP-binding protein OppD [Roseivivax sp. GX 12232]